MAPMSDGMPIQDAGIPTDATARGLYNMLKIKELLLACRLLERGAPSFASRMRIVTTLLLIFAAGPALATTYRWVDANGKVHYGDVMPSQQSGLGHQELDKQGRVVKSTPRTLLTQEERRRRAEETAAHDEHMRRVEDQQRRDRALLSTFANESEIDLARDRALILERSNLNGLQSRLDSTAAKLSFANKQLARLRAARMVEPANLAQMRDEAQAELEQIGAAMRQREKTMNGLKQRFEADKARFQELLELKAIAR
ncbi:MAG: hypothetical protein COW48_06180 [Hydrogenophilales bacterium CG17_big_fil_post_rev_8_21_14_2_50_63_12]|nr:MAG: hypothetical protein COW48_06180 [Hydrogenophilales bacterium CG17_big_fil_post_rev_8_21_14_2_50_63_12]